MMLARPIHFQPKYSSSEHVLLLSVLYSPADLSSLELYRAPRYPAYYPWIPIFQLSSMYVDLILLT